jgi:hypothetical protein
MELAQRGTGGDVTVSSDVLAPMQPVGSDPERANDLTTMTVLVIDAVLLAMLELMFVTFTVKAVPVPVSAVLALLTTPWLIASAGHVSKGALGASGPYLAWILTTGILGFAGPGGDVLLVSTWPALLLIVCGLLPGGYVLGRVLRGKVAARATARPS